MIIMVKTEIVENDGIRHCCNCFFIIAYIDMNTFQSFYLLDLYVSMVQILFRQFSEIQLLEYNLYRVIYAIIALQQLLHYMAAGMALWLINFSITYKIGCFIDIIYIKNAHPHTHVYACACVKYFRKPLQFSSFPCPNCQKIKFHLNINEYSYCWTIYFIDQRLRFSHNATPNTTQLKIWN